MYKLVMTKSAKKYRDKIKNEKNLKNRVQSLLEVIQEDPYKNPLPFEMLKGNFKGLISRRINIQHRLVYEVFEEEKIIKIISMWTHYEF